MGGAERYAVGGGEGGGVGLHEAGEVLRVPGLSRSGEGFESHRVGERAGGECGIGELE